MSLDEVQDAAIGLARCSEAEPRGEPRLGLLLLSVSSVLSEALLNGLFQVLPRTPAEATGSVDDDGRLDGLADDGATAHDAVSFQLRRGGGSGQVGERDVDEVLGDARALEQHAA